MCLAAKHLLWFPVLFCKFNLLVYWMFIFFSTLPSLPAPHLKANQNSASALGLHLVSLALVCALLAGWWRASRSCCLPQCTFQILEENWYSPSAFCCFVFILICVWSESPRGEKRQDSCLRLCCIPPLLLPRMRTSQLCPEHTHPALTARLSAAMLPRSTGAFS